MILVREINLIYGFVMVALGILYFAYLHARKRRRVWDILLGAGTTAAGITGILGALLNSGDWFFLGLVCVGIVVLSYLKIRKSS